MHAYRYDDVCSCRHASSSSSFVPLPCSTLLCLAYDSFDTATGITAHARCEIYAILGSTSASAVCKTLRVYQLTYMAYVGIFLPYRPPSFLLTYYLSAGTHVDCRGIIQMCLQTCSCVQVLQSVIMVSHTSLPFPHREDLLLPYQGLGYT
jgi:hypothetical protein